MLTFRFARRALSGTQTVAVGFALVLAIGGCETPCPAQPTTCATGATLSVAIPDPSAELSAYEIEIVRDDVGATRCFVMLPLPAGWQSSWVASCDGEGVTSIWVGVRPIYDAGCSSDLSGTECAVNLTGHVLVFEMTGEPASVEVALKRGAERFEPYRAELAYQDEYPDGPSCGGGCKRARLEPSWSELTTARVE